MEAPLHLFKSGSAAASHNQWLYLPSGLPEKESSKGTEHCCAEGQVYVTVSLHLLFLKVTKRFALKRFKVVTYMNEKGMWWLSTRIVWMLWLAERLGCTANYQLVY